MKQRLMIILTLGSIVHAYERQRSNDATAQGAMTNQPLFEERRSLHENSTSLLMELEDLQEEVDGFKKSNSFLKEQNERLQIAKQGLEIENQRLKIESDFLRSENNSLHVLRMQLQQKLKDKVVENKLLQARYKKLQKRCPPERKKDE